jgi:tRNA-dihydrouridine synthase
MLQRTGVDGLTIARGAIGNPWIFQQVHALLAGQPLPPPPTVYEQRELIREHFRLSEELYGSERSCSHMRKFCIKYAALHPQHIDVREALVRVKSREEWEAVLERFYSVDAPGHYLGPEIHKAQGSCEV